MHSRSVSIEGFVDITQVFKAVRPYEKKKLGEWPVEKIITTIYKLEVKTMHICVIKRPSKINRAHNRLSCCVQLVTRRSHPGHSIIGSGDEGEPFPSQRRDLLVENMRCSLSGRNTIKQINSYNATLHVCFFGTRCE